MRRLAVVSLILFSLSSSAFALEGYDYMDNDAVEFENGQRSIIEGSVLKVYDYADDSVHEVEVIEVHLTSCGLEIDVFDFEEGDYRIIEVDGQTTGALR